jgi:hypothetical protein
LIFSALTITSAQKLTAVQLVLLRSPDNLKIDGQSSEWNNKFQAYNSNTSTFYTIAKIYLLLPGIQQLAVNRLIPLGMQSISN